MILEVIQWLLNLQVGALFGDDVSTCEVPRIILSNGLSIPAAGLGGICPATAFTAIAAAFSTVGYWVQADVLDFITNTGFSKWASLIYTLGAIGGLCGVAFGMPPKMYVWYLVGPGIFWFLVDTRTPATGVQWQVGFKDDALGQSVENYQDQSEVWKLTETGLLNTYGGRLGLSAGPGGFRSSVPPAISATLPPLDLGGAATVQVANVFLWVDVLVSDTVQQLVRWIAPNHLQGQTTGAIVPLKRNVANETFDADVDNKWSLISGLKWTQVENITDARIHSPKLRESLVNFYASECGDSFARAIDQTNFVMAARGRGETIPASVLMDGPTDATVPRDLSMYSTLIDELSSRYVPFPESLRELVEEDGQSTFRNAVDLGDAALAYLHSSERIACDTYLQMLILALRWEAGHSYYQMTRNLPSNLTEDNLVYNLFYGWDIKVDRDPQRRNILGTGEEARLANVDEQKDFLKDLIFVHLVRNELAMVPSPTDPRLASTERSRNYIENYQRTVGQKSKWGEIYTWALMVPYLQGILLFVFAVGYPFACMFMIVPGMHKAIFTWVTFWAWIKFWDVGFAIVMSLERSIWAMLGNSFDMSIVFDWIMTMQHMGKIQVTRLNPTDIKPIIVLLDGDNLPLRAADFMGARPYLQQMTYMLYDRAMTLGANLQLDIANSYYIYLMSALYFAVPAVMGQLILGAKAGVASMATGAIGSSAGEMGKAAGTGFSGDLTQKAQANAATVGQTSYAKAMRDPKKNLAAQALAAQNAQLGAELSSSAMGAGSQGLSMLGNAISSGQQVSGAALNLSAGEIAFTRAGGQGIAGMVTKPDGKGGFTYSASTPRGQGLQKFINMGASVAGAGAMAAEIGTGLGDSSSIGSSNPFVSAPGLVPSNGSSGRTQASAIPSGGGSGGRSQASALSAAGGSAMRSGATVAGFGASGSSARSGGVPAEGDPVGPAAAGFRGGAGYSPANPESLFATAATWASASSALGAINSLSAQQADLNIAGFQASGASRGYGMQSSRVGGGAEFAARTAAWNAQNAFSNQVSGNLASMGVSPSNFAGSKPMDMMGMAMTGMLGSQNKVSAGYANPNGGAYFSQLGRMRNDLSWGVGSGAIQSTYQGMASRQPQDMMAWGATTVAERVGGAVTGQLGSPAAIRPPVTGQDNLVNRLQQ